MKWEPDDIVDVFRIKKKSKLKKNKLLIFGHNHIYSIKQKKDYVLIQLDCWRDEYVIKSKSGMLTPKEKYYAQILVKDKDLDWKVLQHPLKRSSFKFSSIAKDEIKYLRKAAKEEGFKFKL